MRYFLSFVIAFFILSGFAQRKVDWNFSFDKENEELIMTAEIEEGWHMYSLDVNQEIGPIATSFRFEDNKDIKFAGDVVQPEPIEEYDENFEGDLTFFEGTVSFTQKIKVKKATELKGTVTYMVCNNTMCLPPVDEEFEILIEK